MESFPSPGQMDKMHCMLPFFGTNTDTKVHTRASFLFPTYKLVRGLVFYFEIIMPLFCHSLSMQICRTSKVVVPTIYICFTKFIN